LSFSILFLLEHKGKELFIVNKEQLSMIEEKANVQLKSASTSSFAFPKREFINNPIIKDSNRDAKRGWPKTTMPRKSLVRIRKLLYP